MHEKPHICNVSVTITLREKCPNTEFFLVRIFRIRTANGDLLRKSPYTVRQENTDQKKLRIRTLHAVSEDF